MGMFDTVWFRCPDCDEPISIQSKAGDCELKDYYPDSVPPEIAKAIEGRTEYCPNPDCDAVITVGTQPIQNVRCFLK